MTRLFGEASAYLTDSHRPTLDGLRVANAGLAINPDFAALHAERSITETYLRQFEQAKSDIQQAVRQSPRDPRLGQWRNFMADAELGLGYWRWRDRTSQHGDRRGLSDLLHLP